MPPITPLLQHAFALQYEGRTSHRVRLRIDLKRQRHHLILQTELPQLPHGATMHIEKPWQQEPPRMKYSLAKPGRVFVIRLEDGEILHEVVERFAQEQGIRAASLIAIGGAGEGSRLVVGPADGRARPVIPMEFTLDNVHEVAGVGTLFPNAQGAPILHMHMACGRQEQTHTGCVRQGVRVWQVLEVIIWELTDTAAHREPDAQTGFAMLQP